MAPFSLIKTSTLIFAYLFLRYQTNDQHQVSALSTLNHDDAVSVGNSSSILSSSSEEEDIHRTNVRAKTLGSGGPHVPHKGYGDYHPPLKKGGGGTSPPFGGQYPHPTSRYGPPKKNHVTSNFGSPNLGTLNSGTPKNKSFSQRSKRVKEVLKTLWKKCVCQGKKHPRWMMFFAVVIMVILYLVFLQFGCAGIGAPKCIFPKVQVLGSGGSAAATTACQNLASMASAVTIFTAIAAVVFAILGVLIGCYYCKSLEKYIQSKS